MADSCALLAEAYADACSGLELTERLVTKKYKHEPNMAVMFMVDRSGSPKGWINDAERQALVLLCEALETLGGRYAIYGFSGNTRNISHALVVAPIARAMPWAILDWNAGLSGPAGV